MALLTQTRKALWPAPVYQAVFSDGTVQRMSFYQTRGKPWDFQRGRQLCESARKLFRDAPATIVSGHVEWDESGGDWHMVNDPMGEVVAMPKRRQAKAVLRKLVSYLDGEHDDDSIVGIAREVLAA